jgi:hypothetical protein
MNKNGVPTLYDAKDLTQWANWIRRPVIRHVQSQGKPDPFELIPARPLGWQGLSLRNRLRLAWGVFTGEYDAVRWEDQ